MKRKLGMLLIQLRCTAFGHVWSDPTYLDGVNAPHVTYATFCLRYCGTSEKGNWAHMKHVGAVRG